MSESTKHSGTESEDYETIQLGPKSISLPSNWEAVHLGEVANVNMGSSPKSEYYNEEGERTPIFPG